MRKWVADERGLGGFARIRNGQLPAVFADLSGGDRMVLDPACLRAWKRVWRFDDMTCEKCNHRFPADQNQGWPGHCDPPSKLIAYAKWFTLIAVICGALGLYFRIKFMVVFGWLFLVGAGYSLMHISEARDVCERHDGGVCPSCGHRNKVTWTS